MTKYRNIKQPSGYKQQLSYFWTASIFNRYMHIRTADIQDLAAFEAIEEACFPPGEAASRDSLSKRLEIFPDHFWLLIQGGQLLGFINGMVTDNPTIIDDMFLHAGLHREAGKWQSVFGLAVAPQYRKKGYGARLIEHLILHAKSQKRAGITLTCKAPLIHYYQKFGFHDLGLSACTHRGVLWHDMSALF